MSGEKVLKQYFHIFENESGDSWEIDSNDLVAEKISEFRKKEEEYRLRKEQERIDNMTDEERAEYEQEQMQAGGIDAILTDSEGEGMMDDPALDEIHNELIEQAQSEADSIIAEANARADEILAQATETAESMKEQAIKEGQKQGYDMGQAMAVGEIDTAKQEMDAQVAQIKQEYIDKEIEMEHDVLDVVCDVMSKFFMIEFGDKKQIISHLCENAIANVESSQTLLIRVNEKNKDHLSANKDMLQDKVGENVQLDIILDPILTDDQCIIETDGGIIDCSIGVELDNFIKDLRALTITYD